MRLVGTATICVLIAFGAAFFIAHAAGHHSTTQSKATAPAAKTTALTVPKLATASRLAVDFAPQLGTLRLQVIHHPTRRVHKAAAASPVAASAPTYTSPSTTGSDEGSGGGAESAPETAPTPAPTPATHSSSGSGSSGSHKSGTGSGSTSIG